MAKFLFDPDLATPIVQAIIVGPKASQRVRLVFDTGCPVTQIDLRLLRYVGYHTSSKLKDVSVSGIKGAAEDGQLYRVSPFYVLGESTPFLDPSSS